MPNERDLIRLEAFLDGELDPAAAAEFAAALEDDPALRAELESRRRLRDLFREALLDETPADAPPGSATRTARKGVPYLRIGLALAACLCLAMLVPPLLRDDTGAEGPRSITVAGQVAALRYGEIPGRTVELEVGTLDLEAGFGR